MNKITLLMLILAALSLYFGVFGWFLAGLFVFYIGARTWLKFEDPPAATDQPSTDEKQE